jgi:ElaB/YqjD/DUF883 family membrane-anchored ribosome-binding protein
VVLGSGNPDGGCEDQAAQNAHNERPRTERFPRLRDWFPVFPSDRQESMSPTAQGPSSVTDIEAALDDITAKGTAAFRDAKASVNKAASDAAEKGQEALQGARDMRDSVADAILDSVRRRPYTTLAIAGAIGFLYGAMRRR